MKHILVGVIVGLIGFVVGVVASYCLAGLPHSFNSVEWPSFNRNLPLVKFIGRSMQGLLAAGFLVAALQRFRPSRSVGRVLQAWALTVLLGVAIPAPGIINSEYASGLILWYLPLGGLAVAAFAVCLWSSLIVERTSGGEE